MGGRSRRFSGSEAGGEIQNGAGRQNGDAARAVFYPGSGKGVITACVKSTGYAKKCSFSGDRGEDNACQGLRAIIGSAWALSGKQEDASEILQGGDA
jgi:hypothetical protein